MEIFKQIIFYFCFSIVIWELLEKNVAIAIVASAVLFIDYQMWVRGSKSYIFGDKTQIEKDLREIQKLEIKKKLKEFNK